MNYLQRRQRASDLLAELGLDAIVSVMPNGIRYFSGFTGTDGALVITADNAVFLTDSRYTTQAGDEVVADDIREYSNKLDGVVGLLSECGVKCVGFEANIPYSLLNDFRTKADSSCQWQALKSELEPLRLIKDAQELALIEQATSLNLSAFNDVREMIRPGVSEREIALALEFSQKQQGAEEKSFDFIVASGPRGALPHGVASERCLAEGDLVTIDFGCRVAGYHSDETITVALGHVSDEMRKIHSVVLEAHDLALEHVTPGIPLLELDRVAREHIAAAGYGSNFGHGLGHGVGLEVHEAPNLSPRSTLSAEVGMVFTIEPGIYLPGVGGVRIEDMVVVTEEGCRVLTKIPKTFRNILVD